MKDVDIWIQDECRVGQQGTTTRMWAKKGSRPRAIKQLQFTNTYIFGAVCAAQNQHSAIIVPYSNTEAMQEHLNAITKVVAEGRHAVLVLDRAAWHTTKKLNVPKNLSLLPLPPYSPELNPVEQIWQFLRDRFLANRCFNGYEDIVDACAHAWNSFTQLPGKIKSLCSRKWMTC